MEQFRHVKSLGRDICQAFVLVIALFLVEGQATAKKRNPDKNITAFFDPHFAKELEERGYIADAENKSNLYLL